MADFVNVDSAGLRAAASDSRVVAESLSNTALDGVVGVQSSHTGASAILLAARCVRLRQSAFIEDQARSVREGAKLYDESDESKAADIAKAM